MPVVIFLLMNFIVGATAFLLTYRIFKFVNFIDSLLCWFILYFSQIILSELILGILGILYLKNIILLNSVIILVIWLITKDQPSSFSLSGVRDEIYGLLKNKVVLLSICVILGFALVKVGINLINPPFGWDSLNYHFTFPVEWLKQGNLDTPLTISDDPSPSYYPINGSLFFLWLIFPFKNVFLADLGQIPFFILAFLAIYSISKKIGLDKELSFYAAALFLLIPNVFKQLEIAYADIMVAALFLVCICYLFLLTQEFSRRNVLIYSVSLGLLLGSKTLSLTYGGLLFLPFIYLCFRNVSKSYLFIISVFIIITLGGFSYVRNFLDTANPLYPLDLKLLGKTIFRGVMDILVYRAHFKIEDYNLSKLLLHEGLGMQTLIFILPSILLALPITILKKRKALNFTFTYFLILPILIYFVYRYIIPLANARYLYSLFGMGIITGFYTAKILNVTRPRLKILVVICVLFSILELANRIELIPSVILTSFLFFISPLIIKITQQKRLIGKSFVSILVVLLPIILILLEKDYVRNEYPRYIKMLKYSGFWPDATRAWEWLNKNTSGNNIAYVGRPVPFPLYGSNLKNNVYYVSLNKTEPAKLHFFPHSHYNWDDDFLSLHKNLEAEGNYRGNADYAVWLNNLIQRNADYLFVYSLHQTKEIEFPLEDKWAKTNPSIFSPLFTNETIHIYKIHQ